MGPDVEYEPEVTAIGICVILVERGSPEVSVTLGVTPGPGFEGGISIGVVPMPCIPPDLKLRNRYKEERNKSQSRMLC